MSEEATPVPPPRPALHGSLMDTWRPGCRGAQAADGKACLFSSASQLALTEGGAPPGKL